MWWPSDDDVNSIMWNEYNFPDLFSEFYNYHIEQIYKCSILINKNKIMEYEIMDCDFRYFRFCNMVRKTRIYKICSSNFERIYIGYSTFPLAKRFSEHILTYLSAPNSISSYKVLMYGSSWIELVEECDIMCRSDMVELEGRYMRENIHILVNWKKEGRSIKELSDDYCNGIELEYYAKVYLSDTQENKKRNVLSNLLKRRKIKMNNIDKNDVRIENALFKLREDIDDKNELKRISKYIKDKNDAKIELLKRKEMNKNLDSGEFFNFKLTSVL